MDVNQVTISGPAGALAGWCVPGTDPYATPVLFLHPINMRGRIWEGVVEKLCGERSVYALDYRAHGESDSSGDLSLDDWADDIEAFIDSQIREPQFHVVGGSLGGSLAVCIAQRRPQAVASITGIGSSLNFEGTDLEAVLDMFDELGVEGAFRRVFPTITFGPYVDPAIVEKGLELANPNDVETVKRVWHATVTSDSTASARELDVPSLVITGEYDMTCTPALGLEMARALRTVQVMIPDIGHMPMLEVPSQIANLLQSHWSSVDSRS